MNTSLLQLTFTGMCFLQLPTHFCCRFTSSMILLTFIQILTTSKRLFRKSNQGVYHIFVCVCHLKDDDDLLSYNVINYTFSQVLTCSGMADTFVQALSSAINGKMDSFNEMSFEKEDEQLKKIFFMSVRKRDLSMIVIS